MQLMQLLENPMFGDTQAVAERIFDDDHVEILRCTLQPGQMLWKCRSAFGPVRLIVLVGRGKFTGQDGHERLLGTGTLVAFEANELHKVRALDRRLVFVAVVAKDATQQQTAAGYLVWHRRPRPGLTPATAEEATTTG